MAGADANLRTQDQFSRIASSIMADGDNQRTVNEDQQTTTTETEQREDDEIASQAPYYDTEDLDEILESCSTLYANIPLATPQESFGPKGTFLYHYDVSEENVLIDDTGVPVALLAWEQITIEPFSLVYGFPRIFHLEDKKYITEPKPWTMIGPREEYRVQYKMH